ncbi:MAG: hypothetical protein ACE5K4_04575 [Candidatus Hydrothermarchaeota archaeon]
MLNGVVVARTIPRCKEPVEKLGKVSVASIEVPRLLGAFLLFLLTY